MDSRNSSEKNKNSKINFSILIFFVGLLFTVTLWDAYFNGARPLEKELASGLILAMGILFSISAGLFSWSIESRRDYLEREVEKRTRELYLKNSELEEKNREIENYIHIISHDLKAPIVSIQGFASILKDEAKATLQPEQMEHVERIIANAKRMNALILDLLEFSRVGRVEDEKEEIDVNNTAADLLSELRPQIEKKNIKVVIAENIPPLFGSKKRLSQVLANLISNAAKYMGTPADPKIEVGFSEGQAPGFCKIWVRDNGIGIKKEFQEKIFQIFQRAPNSVKEEGTGVGLSIVKKIVEINGGRVWVESDEGAGSTFYLTWPLSGADV